MVPIYESDVAPEHKERWSEAEWKHYELWEKVELRLKRQRRLWILSTVFVFLLLSSVPIVLDQRPRWSAVSATRSLAQEINGLKRGAGLSGKAHRIRFIAPPALQYVVETAPSCGSGQWAVTAERSLAGSGRLELITEEQGRSLGYGSLLSSICYDPLNGATWGIGSNPSSARISAAGFGVAPVNDLTNGRTDRISFLVLTGPSAETVFD